MKVRVWSRTFANAQKFANEIGAKACSTVEDAASGADVIVTATMATTPILCGKWVKPGALIDGEPILRFITILKLCFSCLAELAKEARNDRSSLTPNGTGERVTFLFLLGDQVFVSCCTAMCNSFSRLLAL